MRRRRISSASPAATARRNSCRRYCRIENVHRLATATRRRAGPDSEPHLGLCGPLRQLIVPGIAASARARPSRHDRGPEDDIPNAGRNAKIARHRVTMMTKMPQSMAAQPGFLRKLPAMHGIVNQEVPDISGDQAARRSQRNLEVPEARENEKEHNKAGDADPDR